MRTGAIVVMLTHLIAVSAGAQTVPRVAPGGGLCFGALPVTMQGRVTAPLRAVFEWLGARVEYRAGRIVAYDAGSSVPRVTLTIGQIDAEVSGEPYRLDVPPVEVGGRTFVPLRFVAESFGVWVDAEGRSVTLQMPQFNLKAKMAVPPAENSHLAKIWIQIARWYGLGGAQPRALIRITDNTLDLGAGRATVEAVSAWADGRYTRDRFSLVLQRDGWHVTDHSSSGL